VQMDPPRRALTIADRFGELASRVSRRIWARQGLREVLPDEIYEALLTEYDVHTPKALERALIKEVHHIAQEEFSFQNTFSRVLDVGPTFGECLEDPNRICDIHATKQSIVIYYSYVIGPHTVKYLLSVYLPWMSESTLRRRLKVGQCSVNGRLAELIVTVVLDHYDLDDINELHLPEWEAEQR
jgi:hypothetical protein